MNTPRIIATQDMTRAHLGMLVWALIVGLSFPAVGLMSEGLPPLLLTAMRFAIAALAIWPLVRREPGRWPSLPGLALYAFMGLCLAGFFGTMFWAAHRVTALSMATLYVSVPLLAYCLGRGFGVERPAGRMLGTLLLGALGALGLAWAQTGGRLDDLRLGIGEAVYFVGCLASALYPVLSKWGLNQGWLSQRASLRTFWSLLTGGALIGLLGLIWESPHALAGMTLSDVLVLSYLGVFSSGVTFWLLQRATAVLTPGAATAYTYLVPFVSMLLLLIDQPQRVGWHWLPGSLLVVVAIAMLLRRDATRHDDSRRTEAA
ncbi:EamA-like transporter family protein [Modicisalibacter muralis]|uniref:EamA-like transporter family protein n=1 Tax=Modicisalibacter muralis TaxID=119000 RepID=A0A1G9S0L4_9GAMM|nr:DMT family transporter [Halomonas muralis]SDM29088.1 EamA-like transporter family protein [Halomonas muralis]